MDDLVPDHIRANKSLLPPPPPRKRGQKKKRKGGEAYEPLQAIKQTLFLVWDWPIIQPQLWSIFRALLTA